MIKRFIILMTALWMMSNKLSAQTVTKGLEMGELIRISYAYRQTPYLSFDITYQYADSAAPSTILEQINGQYKIHDGRYWAMLDSTELVQGNNYSLAVFHDQKIISVHKPVYTDDKVLQLPVMDTIFYNYSDSLSVTQLSDSIRLLKVYLKQGLPYSGYEVRYNSNSYFVNSVQYYMKGAAVLDSIGGGSGTSLIKVTLSNYSEAPISEDVFMESKFVYRDSSFYTRPDYSDYELMVDGDF